MLKMYISLTLLGFFHNFVSFPHVVDVVLLLKNNAHYRFYRGFCLYDFRVMQRNKFATHIYVSTIACHLAGVHCKRGLRKSRCLTAINRVPQNQRYVSFLSLQFFSIS